MIAVDTNVVLRLILGDDPRQISVIQAMFARNTIHIGSTVMLETGWVLASRYRMPRDEVADALDAVLALDGVDVAQRDLMDWAVARYRAGADWADMIHVTGATKLDGFATLDRKLARDAGLHPPVPIETLA